MILTPLCFCTILRDPTQLGLLGMRARKPPSEPALHFFFLTALFFFSPFGGHFFSESTSRLLFLSPFGGHFLVFSDLDFLEDHFKRHFRAKKKMVLISGKIYTFALFSLSFFFWKRFLFSFFLWRALLFAPSFRHLLFLFSPSFLISLRNRSIICDIKMFPQ